SVGFAGLSGADVNRIWTGSESVAPRVSLRGTPSVVKGIDQWIHPSALLMPPVGSSGVESARYIAPKPRVNNWDISVFKNIPIWGETRFVQLRLEMFNAPNHTQYSDFNRSITFNAANGQITNLPTSKGGGGGRYGFGAINAARDPRFVQL